MTTSGALNIAPYVGAGALLALAVACVEAPTTEDLSARAREATISVLGEQAAGGVEVSSVVRKPTTATWQAKTPSGVYDCDADERFSMPQCALTDG
jgi:hypothetical protein